MGSGVPGTRTGTLAHVIGQASSSSGTVLVAGDVLTEELAHDHDCEADLLDVTLYGGGSCTDAEHRGLSARAGVTRGSGAADRGPGLHAVPAGVSGTIAPMPQRRPAPDTEAAERLDELSRLTRRSPRGAAPSAHRRTALSSPGPACG